jgi:general secretion pathway protein H
MRPTEPKAGPARPQTSRAGNADDANGEAGFTLIEIVCVLAIITMLAAIVMPSIPRGTSRARLESFAVEAAAMLKGDRNSAIRGRAQVATRIDPTNRSIRSGATGRVIRIPDDVAFDATLAARCNQRPDGATIRFFASGMSCGGVIALSRLGVGYQIRVNWLTGGVEIVSLGAS